MDKFKILAKDLVLGFGLMILSLGTWTAVAEILRRF